MIKFHSGVEIDVIRPSGLLGRLRCIVPQPRNFSAARINHLQMVTRGAAEAADAELVIRALGGDRDAFEALYRRYQAMVYRFARSMTGSAAMAEDVTQEVFVALMRDLARYEPRRAALPTYLYGVARNVTRSRLRREHRFVAFDDVTSEEAEPATPDDPAETLARSQDLSRLRKAIVDLPSRYREVVVLCDLHGLSYAEAAGVVNVPVGTIRSRLHRGRTLLVERLRCPDPTGARTAIRRTARCLA
jgi:RNA polymerase sigma-70 factor (ECF subfamily)